MPGEMGLATATAHAHGLTAEGVAEELRKLILAGALGVGVQLKQEALARRFGVSRFPVREALRKLQAEGLVTHTPNAGSVVASRTIADLIEICDIRIGLELRALELAIPNLRPADVKAARAILARYDASELPREWAELNLEFHLSLYRPCGRPRLLKMIEDIVRSSDIQLRARRSYLMGRKGPQAEHREILAACVAKDAAKATALLKEHLERTQQVLQAARDSDLLG